MRAQDPEIYNRRLSDVFAARLAEEMGRLPSDPRVTRLAGDLVMLMLQHAHATTGDASELERL